MRAREFISEDREDFFKAIRDFLPIAIKTLKLKSLPKITISKNVVSHHDQPTFGRYDNKPEIIHLDVEERHPIDIIRTLAHELVHYKQDKEGKLNSNSWKTGSPQENEAHELAGIMMREFDKQFSKYLKLQAVEFTESLQLNELNVAQTLKFIKQAHGDQLYGKLPYWTHPRAVALTGKKIFGKRFSSDAVKTAFLHDVVEDTHIGLDELNKLGFDSEVINAVALLTKDKTLGYSQNIERIINSGNLLAMMVKYADNYENYSGDKSDWDPKRAAASQKKYLASLNMLGDKLGVKHHIGENFADGKVKGKSRPGRVKRSGASCNGSVTDLRSKAKNSSGERAKMYHWCANMKSGRNK